MASRREFPADLPHELCAYLAEVKGLQAYYSRELAKLRLTYQVAEHDLHERDTDCPDEPIVPDGERLVYGGREFIVRPEGATELREPTPEEADPFGITRGFDWMGIQTNVYRHPEPTPARQVRQKGIW